jgi:hypothetical protein
VGVDGFRKGSAHPCQGLGAGEDAEGGAVGAGDFYDGFDPDEALLVVFDFGLEFADVVGEDGEFFAEDGEFSEAVEPVGRGARCSGRRVQTR